MKLHIFVLSTVLTAFAAGQTTLRPALEQTYNAWREAIVRQDAASWQRVTASHRRIEVQNRISAQKLPFPAALFKLPAPPPTLKALTFLEATEKGPTATAAYFGKIDFGVGGTPTQNLLVLAFVNENGEWLYDRADFVNLEALPEVRRELATGNLKYLKETPEAHPSGKMPPQPLEAPPAKYIAKIYVFSPGREVKVQVNKFSHHRFANSKEAEIIIGGALDGRNEVQYAISKLPGGKDTEALTIRVYLLSQVKGVKPLKAFEYQVLEHQPPRAFGTGSFNVDAAMVAKLMGQGQ
ncbi:MAG: hypothetical protein WCP35_10440 [Verrucomicrobiota bacterium]